MENSGNERIQELTQANEQLVREVAELKRTEKVLRANVEQYRTVVDDIPVLICRFLPDGEITYVNEAYCKYFTCTSEQLVGSSFLSLIPEGEREVVMNNISALTVESPIQSQEHQVIAPDGKIRWQRWTNRALFDDKGNIFAYQAIGEDITESRQVENALRESRNRLHQITDTIEDVCWITDWKDRQIIFASPAYEKIWGRSLQSLYANPKDWAEAIHPDDRESAWDNFLLLGETKSYDEEYRIVRADGSIRWIRDRGFPVYDESGDVYRVAGIAQDITERKRIEDALLKSEERFQLAAKGATDGLWYSDLSTGKEWWSQQYRELIGFSSDELPSTFESWKSILHPDDFERVMEAVRRHFEENQAYDIEYRMQTKTRGYRWFRARGVATRGKDNKPVRIAGSIQDITDNMQAETALRISDRLSAIGTMVAGVAHEINTPLTTILGLAELMAKNTTLDTPMREYADQIVYQAVRTRKIIDNLLGLSRSGRISDASVQINDTIQRSLNNLRNSHRFDGVEIVEDFDHNLPETFGDANRLEQVFVNIIRNAGDAMREVTTIKRLTIKTEQGGDHIRILFTDTGHGVGDPSRIFDAFFTTKAIGKGAGLGLSISLGIVQEHGGDITVETSNKNTQFLVTLPIRSKSDTAKTIKI